MKYHEGLMYQEKKQAKTGRMQSLWNSEGIWDTTPKG